MAKPRTRPARTPAPKAQPRPARPATRSPIVIGAALVALIVLAVWWWRREPVFSLAQRADRNVLLVSIDTLRADVLGSYGGRALTPNLDGLAAHGARFTFAHSHAVVTRASHASMLTGLYPYEHGVRDNAGYRLPPTMPTAATRLKALGFATGAFIGGFPLDKRFGLTSGFDVYDDLVGEIGSQVDFMLPDRRADEVVKPALAWIHQQSGKWFAFVHCYDPHAPYKPPAEWLQRFPNDPYLGEVSWTDFALGALFDALSAQPRSTLVIVTADHGEGLGDHGELTHSLFAYESTLHVPLIVAEIAGSAGPGTPSTRGVVVDSSVRHVDLVPTILDAIAAAPDAALPGTSLRDLIASGRGADRPSYFEAMTANLTRGWAPLRGVVAGRDKYIDLPIPELYDLGVDPREQQNTVSARADRASVLQNVLKSFNVALPGRPHDETAAVKERMRSLGYVTGVAPVRERYTEDDDPKRLVDLEQAMHRATEAFETGKLDDAAALYRSVLARRPDMEDAYRYLAFIYWQQGKTAAAISTLEDALRRGLPQAEIRIKLGEYLSQTGQAARAIQLLEGAIGDDPDALIALGIAYGTAGRSQDAMRTFKRILDIDSTSGLAYQNIAALQLSAGDETGAEASLRQALTLDPKLPGAYTTLGVVLSKTGRKAEAVANWKQALKLDPTEFDALYNLTVVLAATGQLDEARTYGQRYVDTAPPSLYSRQIAEVRRFLGGGKL
ncbi:MAG TPA: sulfatase-like hydrolase/transferase [Vicinamibacterales bacterium]|nr:sulfatase-like hydrolase/transferase [Vicinamibacterales bacterium]